MKNTGLSIIKNSLTQSTNISHNENRRKYSFELDRKHSIDSNNTNETITCNIKKLDISSCSFNDSEIRGLISKTHALSLREINLRYNSHMTKNGWQTINQGIKASANLIQSLNVLDCALDDEKASGLLFQLDLNNLNSLNLGDNPALTKNGYTIFNCAIKNSYKCLNSINIWGCGLDDIKLYNLFDDMMLRWLRELNLSGNCDITQRGYSSLKKVIYYSSNSLVKLHLSGCDLDDDKI